VATSKPVVYFGIDPGTAVTGFGVVKTLDNAVSWLDSGVIRLASSLRIEEKLEKIFDSLSAKLTEHSPACVCVEQAFYGKNAHTSLVLGLSRGVALLAAKKCGAGVVEFSPLEIKKAVTGNGNATKDQVGYMVKVMLSPPDRKSLSDEYDALAAALCAFYHRPLLR
jgi:crossover junction endodeoxyribonuclease RuvC